MHHSSPAPSPLRPAQGLPGRFLLALASLRLTLVGLLFLGMATVIVYQLDQTATPWLAAPLLLLALNLMAAVATNRVFRRQMPLLVFHLALIVLVLLAAAGRMTYLKGQTEVTEGAAFERLTGMEAGPWHGGRLDQLYFVNDGFEISYVAGPVLDRNVSRVRWRDASGQPQRGEIEQNQPLVLLGYRIYPTSNKGFAPLFVWQANQQQPLIAAVHLPSYPANATAQAQTWRPPGSTDDIWLALNVDENLIPSDRSSQLRLPDDRTLVLRHRGIRYTLQPGERLALPDGTLEYRDLRTWMGYRIFYDWTIPWMLAACAMAVVSMAWHFGKKFAATPWNTASG
jgi:cytochrome c biogenesis protein